MDGKWIILCAVGELIGFSAAAIFNIIHLVTVGEPTTVSGGLLVLTLAFLGGIAEGSVLAAFQWHYLRDHVPSLERGPWIRWTATVAGLGWLAGMFYPTFFMDQTQPASDVAEPPLILIGLVGLLMGLSLGALFGLFQSIPLRGSVENAGIWVGANALGWAVAMVILMIGPSVIPAGAGMVTIIAYAVVSGVLAGLCIGIVTGEFIPRFRQMDSA